MGERIKGWYLRQSANEQGAVIACSADGGAEVGGDIVGATAWSGAACGAVISNTVDAGAVIAAASAGDAVSTSADAYVVDVTTVQLLLQSLRARIHEFQALREYTESCTV